MSAISSAFGRCCGPRLSTTAGTPTPDDGPAFQSSQSAAAVAEPTLDPRSDALTVAEPSVDPSLQDGALITEPSLTSNGAMALATALTEQERKNFDDSFKHIPGVTGAQLLASTAGWRSGLVTKLTGGEEKVFPVFDRTKNEALSCVKVYPLIHVTNGTESKGPYTIVSREYRVPARRFVLDSVGGTVEKEDFDPLVTAKNELSEEAGLRVIGDPALRRKNYSSDEKNRVLSMDWYEYPLRCHSSPGCISETRQTFGVDVYMELVPSKDTLAEQLPDPGEVIHREVISMDQLSKYLQECQKQGDGVELELANFASTFDLMKCRGRSEDDREAPSFTWGSVADVLRLEKGGSVLPLQ